jgi:hypothetical protein
VLDAGEWREVLEKVAPEFDVSLVLADLIRAAESAERHLPPPSRRAGVRRVRQRGA